MADQALEIFHDYFNENYAQFPTQYLNKEEIENSEFDSLLIEVPQEDADSKFISTIFFPRDKENFPFVQIVQFYYPVLDNLVLDTPPAVSQFINHINGILPIGFFVKYDSNLVLRQLTTLPTTNIEANMSMLGNVFQFVIAFGQMYPPIITQLLEGKISFDQAVNLANDASAA